MGNICLGKRETIYKNKENDLQTGVGLDQLALPLKNQPIIQNSVVASTEKPNHIALFDYDKATMEDTTIKTNDPLLLLNQSDEDWWLVKNLRTEETGFVPRFYISPVDDLEAKEWFFPECTRREAERLLEYLDNEPGIFLIRDSEQDKNLFAANGKDSNGLCRNLTKPCPKVKNFMGYKDVWEESQENIDLGETIGSGNFGEVFKGIWRKKHVVAVKTIKFQASDNNKTNEMRYNEFSKELEIMKKLRHEKIVKLWCVCTKSEPIFLVTEYMINGNLLKYLRSENGNKLKLKEIIDMAAQIASGMRYLEGSKCVHRDLAARNILVGEKNIVKIADFGFAQMLNQDDKIEFSKDDNSKFPVKWTAPEVFSVDPTSGKRQYTIKSDVWSYGITLYEIITKGSNPYPGMNHTQVIHEIKKNNYRMPKPNGMCTDDYYGIMRKCWEADPNHRPTFDALLNYFNEYFVFIQPTYKEPG